MKNPTFPSGRSEAAVNSADQQPSDSAAVAQARSENGLTAAIRASGRAVQQWLNPTWYETEWYTVWLRLARHT